MTGEYARLEPDDKKHVDSVVNMLLEGNLREMDADHVSAWSKGGATDIANCQMLCRAHNIAKGNK